MSNRINLEANHITAGKFIPVGKDSLSLKQKLRQIGQTVSSSSNDLKFSIINGMASDNVITPEEKFTLKQELDYIISGFVSIEKNVNNIGLANSIEFLDFKKIYDELLNTIEPILVDMTTSSEIPDGFLSIFQKYTSASNAFNNFIIAYQSGLQSKLLHYELQVYTISNDISEGESSTLKAYLYLDDSDVTQLEMNKINVEDSEHPYPTLFKWSFTGLKDNDAMAGYALGKREISIPFDYIAGNSFTASFQSTIEIIN